MPENLAKKLKKSTFFERLLLIIGVSVAIMGFWMINKAYLSDPTATWGLIMSVFLWLILIFIIILTDSNESIKEELSTIIKEHIEETKLLKKRGHFA